MTKLNFWFCNLFFLIESIFAETSWLDLNDHVAESFGRDPKLEKQLEADTRHTLEVLTQYKNNGGTFKKIKLDNEKHEQQKKKELTINEPKATGKDFSGPDE